MLILLFNLSKIFFKTFVVLFIISCGLQPLNYPNEKVTIFFEFQKNPLNLSLVQEIKKNFFIMNASEVQNKESASYVVKISDHRLGKFLEATDRDLFPAIVSLDYQVKIDILKESTGELYEIPIFSSEDFSYDTESILSNENKADEIKIDFFSDAINELIIFFSEKSNA